MALIVGFLIAIVISIATIRHQQHLESLKHKGKLSLVENQIAFSITSADKTAANILGNEGSGLYLVMGIECLNGPISYKEARLEIRRSANSVYKLHCKLVKPGKFVSMHTGDFESITFIANPEPYGNHYQEIIRKFVGAIYKFTIVSTRGPLDEILNIESNYLNDIVIPRLVNLYSVCIPTVSEQVEAERIRDILKANGVPDVTIDKLNSADLSKVTQLNVQSQ